MKQYLTDGEIRTVAGAVAQMARLDDDQLARVEAVLKIALGDCPRAYAGLKPAHRKLIDLLWASYPRTVPYAAILDVIAKPDTDPEIVKAQKAKLRSLRRDMGVCILTVWGVGLRRDGPSPDAIEDAFLAGKAAAV